MTATIARRAVVADPMRDRIAALEARVAVLERLARDRAANRIDDARMVAALALYFGSSIFSAKDVRAARDEELRAIVAGRSTHAIGLRLRKVCGRVIDGYRLDRVTRNESGTVWAIHVDP